MPRCSCAGSTCGCKLDGGAGITVTGLGTIADPYVISAVIGDLASAMSFDDTADVVFTVVGDGTPGDPLVISAATPRKNFPVYPVGGLPDPTVWGEGAFAYDQTSKQPVFSDGTAWKYASALPSLSPKAAGNFIAPSHRASTSGSVSYASGNIHPSPIYLPRPLTIDQVGVRVSTLEAATSAILLLFRADADGFPATRVLQSAAMDCSSTGAKTAAPVGGSVALSPGLYWGFIRTNSPGGTVRFTAITPDYPYGAFVESTNYAPGSTQPRVIIADPGSYASPAATISSWTYGDQGANVAPFFTLRRA